MNRLEKNYFYNGNKPHNNLISSLDCLEKVLYHALSEHIPDCKYAFCNDINLNICQCHKLYNYYPNRLDLNTDLFKIESYCPEPEKSLTLLEQLIDSGTLVAINTMFDILPPYTWYMQEDKRGKSNTHFCTIIGYDENNYFFVDDPSMLVDERLIRYNNNPTIGLIKKNTLKTAFNEYCQIITVKVNKGCLPYINKFDVIKSQVIDNYNSKSCFYDDTIVILGRNALEKLTTDVYDDAILSTIVSNFYWVHLMYSRRILFKECIKDISDNNTNINLILMNLDKSISEWKAVYRIIATHVYKRQYSNLPYILSKRIEKIINIEDSLIESLNKL